MSRRGPTRPTRQRCTRRYGRSDASGPGPGRPGSAPSASNRPWTTELSELTLGRRLSQVAAFQSQSRTLQPTPRRASDSPTRVAISKWTSDGAGLNPWMKTTVGRAGSGASNGRQPAVRFTRMPRAGSASSGDQGRAGTGRGDAQRGDEDQRVRRVHGRSSRAGGVATWCWSLTSRLGSLLGDRFGGVGDLNAAGELAAIHSGSSICRSSGMNRPSTRIGTPSKDDRRRRRSRGAASGPGPSGSSSGCRCRPRRRRCPGVRWKLPAIFSSKRMSRIGCRSGVAADRPLADVRRPLVGVEDPSSFLAVAAGIGLDDLARAERQPDVVEGGALVDRRGVELDDPLDASRGPGR